MTLPKFIITMESLVTSVSVVGTTTLTLFPTASSLTENHTTLAVPNGICWKH